MTTGSEEAAASAPEQFKEIQMDVRHEGGGTRRRRRARRSKTQRGGGEEGTVTRTLDVSVEKAHALAPAPVIVTSPAAAIVTAAPHAAQRPLQSGGNAAPQTGGATVAKQLAAKPAIKSAIKPTSTLPLTPKVSLASIIVLAPAKKKAKIMLVSKKVVGLTPVATIMPPKTFKAKRIRVTIDNTARTQKRRRQVLRSVDSLTEEQLREQAVKFGLSRTDSVKKVPAGLLRKMLKDYYAMRKGFL
jgi:hypothetical protein